MKVVWTVPAARALENIQDYIAKDNQHAAWEVAQNIRHAVSQLADHPKLGRTGRVRATCELVIAGLPYIVPYRLKGKEIHILSVYHAARKWPERLNRFHRPYLSHIFRRPRVQCIAGLRAADY